MISDAQLARMRDTVEDAMPDTCTITRPSADPTFNPATGTYTPAALTAVYAGVCRVRPTEYDRVVQAGEEPVSLRTFNATLPYDSGDIRIDDTLTVTVSSDPELVDKPLRVRDVQYGSWQINRRLIVEYEAG